MLIKSVFAVLGRAVTTGRALALLVGVGLVAAGALLLQSSGGRRDFAAVSLVPVQRQDLFLHVVERGRVESQNVVEIKCEVPRGGSRRGVRILYLVPEGTRVKKGDLLIEFDSSWVRERYDRIYASYHRSFAHHIWRSSSFEKEQIVSQIRLTQAQLDLERAKLRLEQFENEAGGRFAMDLQQAMMDLEEALALVAEAQTRLMLEQTRLEGVRMLFERGYRGRGDLEQATFAYLQARDMLTRARNAVKTAQANIRLLKDHIYPVLQLELTAAVKNAEMNLELVQKESAGKLAELAAWKESAELQLRRTEYWLQRFETWLKNCKVYAPVDGVVIYGDGRTWWTRYIGEGDIVFYRMTVLRIPDLRRMQVELEVHEAVLDELKEGQRAEIYVDGISDSTYTGTVAKVERVPKRRRRWHERSVNVYEVVVKIDGEVQRLRPGMTASVRIQTGVRKDALVVPATALFRKAGRWWCFVASGNEPQPREVEVGVSNDRYAQVLRGLQEGDLVVAEPYTLPPDLFPPEPGQFHGSVQASVTGIR